MVSRRSDFCIWHTDWHADWCFTVYGKLLAVQTMTVKPRPVLVDVSVSSTVASG